MPGPNDPNAQTQMLSPDGLASQLWDAAFVQSKGDPREAARQVIIFLTEAIVFAISSSAGDENARKAMLKNIGDTIASAPPLQKAPAVQPKAPGRP